VARYIVLAVDDNADAQKLVDMIEKWKYVEVVYEVPETSAGETSTTKYVDLTVRAMYAKPTLFCEMRASHSKHGFSRGKKFGWMVCAAPGCGRPTKAWATGDGWFANLGTNLLPVSEERPEYRGFGMKGHHWDGQAWVQDKPGEGAGA
jgi:hypothetical protein